MRLFNKVKNFGREVCLKRLDVDQKKHIKKIYQCEHITDKRGEDGTLAERGNS